MGIEIVSFERIEGILPDVKHLGYNEAKKVKHFHESFPMYEKTPLHELRSLAKELCVKNIYVKDESYRFGLNAFKVLGGSYAIGNYIAQKLGVSMDTMTYERIISQGVRDKIGECTFVSATDGNHGRGVAWTANKLKQKCVIHMPKGSANERLLNIQAEGATADITDLNYDDAVRLSSREAIENGWVLVQDTSWDGYEEIPTRIMQGYTTLSLEIFEQLKGVKPTHIFLQAGVGSFATSVTGFFADVYNENRPIITVVEPNAAACVYKTMKSDDGQIHPVTGDMNTIMAGLACGEPVTVGVNILRNYVDNFVSCPDYVAANGMRALAKPIGHDPKIVSGESGAVGFGFMREVFTDPDLANIKKRLKLDENSIILCISTEGDTDKENYTAIVEKGAYSKC
ncbi:MAG: diaminopropionate ammonia-lyase [Pseudobutyrivibrio sp.]|nr:diaminopropionate ammonia-lyase [Pseudobutyrivibrio sp.]